MDVERISGNIDVNLIEKITKKTKALIIVHGWFACDMDKSKNFAKNTNLN